MFLGCSLFGDNKALETMNLNVLKYKYEAALVLWKRDKEENDEIKVHKAISFGTEELTNDHKKQYGENEQDMLPGVESDSVAGFV